MEIAISPHSSYLLDEAVIQPCVAREVTGSPLRHEMGIIKVGTGPSHEDPM